MHLSEVLNSFVDPVPSYPRLKHLLEFSYGFQFWWELAANYQ